MEVLKRPLVALALVLPALRQLGSWTQGGAPDLKGDLYTANVPGHLAPLSGSTGSLVGRQAPNCSPVGNPTFSPVQPLNNPFTFVDGRPVTNEDDWFCRRQEIATLFQRYELGSFPPAPASFNASLSDNVLTINVGSSNATTSFTVTIEYPSGSGPFPAIIGIGGSSLPASPGIASINFNNREIALDSGPIGRGQGKFYDLYGPYHSAGALVAWSWAVSRIIDALGALPLTRIDVTKLAITGCSTNGKAALVAGAFDDRIALTIPQESGAGGAGCWRISDALLSGGVGTVTAAELANSTSYFSTAFNAFASRIPTLPFDHHLLASLVAPRGLLILDNSQYTFLGPPSVYGCMKTAQGVYRSLGVGSRMGVSIVGDHNHCVFPGPQFPELNAYINKFLRGIDGENTNLLRTDVPNNGGFEETRFINWTVPRLVAPLPPPPPPAPGVCDAPLNLTLSSSSRLNNPFIFVNGSRTVNSPDDWFCRRQEIGSLFQRYELGYVPTEPPTVTGSLSDNILTVTVSQGGKTISFPATINYPEGNGPFAAIIGIGGSSLPQPPEIAIITFNNFEIATDQGPAYRGAGKFYDLYGENHSAGVLMAWAWAVSRIIDALSSTANVRIDTTHLGVTGCSNNGKAALVAGAFEQRIALTIPVESGAGGAGCWRVSDTLGSTITARDLINTTSYFALAFEDFGASVPRLPIDHHLLAAMVAPRGLLVLDNSQYPWLGPPSVYGCMVTANKIYRALGYRDRLGISIVGQHDHCVFPGQQYPELFAYVNKFLRGSSGENTNVIKTDVPNNGGFEESRWVDWLAPSLLPPPPAPPAAVECDAPAQLSLTPNSNLNNPFIFLNGSRRVRNPGDWFCRRQEIGNLFQRLEFGYYPSPPTTTGSLNGNILTVSVSHEGRNISFAATIKYPEGNGPFAAIIGIGGSSLPDAPEIASITFPNLELATDEGAEIRGEGKFYQLYGAGHQGGTLVAWAWGASRIIDALASTPNTRIDPQKIGVTGCSNNGKAALVAGAFDQRISLTIPVESGTGGAGCFRIAEELSQSPPGTITASNLINTTSYFSQDFRRFGSQLSTLPVDHHLLGAMVAPRGLLVLDNTQYPWLGPSSVFGCMSSARKVYDALGFRDRLGISLVGGHDHCIFPGQQYPELFAFINKFLRGSFGENTEYVKIDIPDNGGYEESRWLDWYAPDLTGVNPYPPVGWCAPPGDLTLTPNTRLPNPYRFADPTKAVQNSDDWFCRRDEVADLFQRYELGTIPPKPATVTGSLSGSDLTISVSEAGRNISFRATIKYPGGDGPFPAFIAVGGSSLPETPGIAVITLNNTELAYDSGPSARGYGKFYDIYGRTHSAGVLAAWAWGVSRVIDALTGLQGSKIDTSKLGVTGCTAGGKAALVAGAFDHRLVLTIPVESGAGGAGCWRVSDATSGTVTAGELANTTAYFRSSFGQVAVNTLPFDHHLLAGLVAPRGLLVLDNSGLPFLGPSSVYGCMVTANKIYSSLGIGDRLGVSVIGDHDLCTFAGPQYPEYNAFVNKFLRGIAGENTNVIKTDIPNNGGFDEPRWVDWTPPLLPLSEARKKL